MCFRILSRPSQLATAMAENQILARSSARSSGLRIHQGRDGASAWGGTPRCRVACPDGRSARRSARYPPRRRFSRPVPLSSPTGSPPEPMAGATVMALSRFRVSLITQSAVSFPRAKYKWPRPGSQPTQWSDSQTPGGRWQHRETRVGPRRSHGYHDGRTRISGRFRRSLAPRRDPRTGLRHVGPAAPVVQEDTEIAGDRGRTKPSH